MAWSGGWNKGVMEKGMQPSSCSVLNGFSQWHPVAPDLKTEGKAQTVMGDRVPEMHTGLMYLGVYVSPAHLPRAVCSLDWGTLNGSGWEGHWCFLVPFKHFFFLLETGMVRCIPFSGKPINFLILIISILKHLIIASICYVFSYVCLLNYINWIYFLSVLIWNSALWVKHLNIYINYVKKVHNKKISNLCLC